MKKCFLIALALLTVMSALAACAPAVDRLDASVSLASSDAAEYAAWLDERLDTFPTDVVVGIGSSEAYGIDMTDFDDDGYVIRTIGDDTLLFGASADGLDRAVRKYAKAAEAGTAEDLNRTYHEGERIKRLTVAGNDISEYTIYIPAEETPDMSFAATELQQLVEKACGVKLSIKNGNPSGKYFTFGTLTDESLNDSAWEYVVENGNVTFKGKADFGCPYAVYFFLEDQLSWKGLTHGDSILCEAEHVDIPEGTSDSRNPRMNYLISPPVGLWLNERSTPTAEQMNYGMYSMYYCGRFRHACHGMYTYSSPEFHNPDGNNLPCYTSKSFYGDVYDNVLADIEAKLAAGMTLGKDLRWIDISAIDVGHGCSCKNCQNVTRKENGSYAGPVVLFANQLDDEMDELGYDGIKWGVFAYMCTLDVCKTAPNPDVQITFCMNHSCSNHALGSYECDPGFNKGSRYMGNALREWCEITEDVFVWYYTMGSGIATPIFVDSVYEDFNFFRDVGVYGVYIDCSDSYGSRDTMTFNRFNSRLAFMLQWDPDMTREEYYAALDVLLEGDYGDGWEYVRGCVDHWIAAENAGGCWHCWADVFLYPEWDVEYGIEHYDEVYELAMKAIPLANDDFQEKMCKNMLANIVYRGSATNFFTAYDLYDEEKLALIEERWTEMCNILGRTPVGSATFADWAWTKWQDVDLEGFANYRDLLSTPGIERRPAPEKYQ